MQYRWVNCKNSFWMSRSIEQVIEEIDQNMSKKDLKHTALKYISETRR